MSEILDLLKNSLLTEDFYIPSLKAERKGRTLSVGQYNKILELTLSEEDISKDLILLTDKIIQENIDDTAELSYFDKVFILNQIKLSNKSEILGITGERYKENLRNKCIDLDLNKFDLTYVHGEVEILFGIRTFDFNAYLNTNYFEAEDSSIFVADVLRSIKDIKYGGKSLDIATYNIVELFSSLPSSIIEKHTELQTSIQKTIKDLNLFSHEEEEFILYPSADILLL